MAELHGLSSRRPLIQQGGVGDRQPCHITYHCLVVKQRLQTTLRNLRLVWCVLCDPDKKTEGCDFICPL